MQILASDPLSFKIDKNQLALGDRLDVEFFHPKYLDTERKLFKSKFKYKNVSEVSKVICGPFGSAIKVGDYVKRGVPLIRVGNIKDGEVVETDETDLAFVTSELSEKLKSTQVSPKDIVISQRGTIGNVALVPEKFPIWNISANLIAIKEMKINPEFLWIVLASEIGYRQLERRFSGHIQKKITTDDIKSIKIPVPPITIQKKAIKLMRRAGLKRESNLKKVGELKEKLDSYFFKHLGLTPPGKKEKTFFVAKLEDRFDIEHYRPEFIENMRLLKKGRFKLVPLISLTKEIYRGIEPGSREYLKEGVLFLRVQNLKKGAVEVGPKSVFLDIKFYNKNKEFQPKKKDILFSKDGTIGLTTVYKGFPKRCLIASGVALIRTKKNISPYYLTYFLNSKLAELQALRESYGSIIKHLSMKSVQALLVPSPDIKTQKIITEKIKKVDYLCLKLQKEAENTVESAMRKVEKMILRR